MPRPAVWRKLGRIYVPDGSKPWARSHAAYPVAEHIGGDAFRVYFSTRDAANRSSIAYVDIDMRAPTTVLREADAPVLSPGAPGTFDDSGVTIGCIVPVGNCRYLYYTGWHVPASAPWQTTIGLAISDGPERPFERHSPIPILPVNDIDPYKMTYPWVLHESGTFRMWYGSDLIRKATREDSRHLVKYAESTDGIDWRRENRIAVDFAGSDEYGICRPCVRLIGGRYRMWFCGGGPTYRILYAESDDAVAWQRRDDAVGIDLSAMGWDSEMIEYPFVFEHRGERYLLYNGNGYGRTGFGIAQLEQD